MANTASPVGFLHQGNTEGVSPTFGQRKITISSSAGAIYKNDPVKILSTGYASQWTAATAVSQLAGIFIGCEYQGNAGQGLVRSAYWPGSGATGDVTGWIIPLNLSVSGWFLAQAVGTTGILFADVGQNVDVSIGTGSTATGMSGAGVDQSTLGVTATLPFRVMALGPAIGPSGTSNDNTLANNWVYVAANVSGAGSTGI